jgi:hypothetical protein
MLPYGLGAEPAAMVVRRIMAGPKPHYLAHRSTRATVLQAKDYLRGSPRLETSSQTSLS